MNQSPHFKWKFSQVEDLRLAEVVAKYGPANWTVIAGQMPGRNARQCRERWTNYIKPGLHHTPLSPEEDMLLEQKCLEIGPRWQLIVTFFPGRARNCLKNHWIAKHRRLHAEADVRPGNAGDVEKGGRNVLDLAFEDDDRQQRFWEVDSAYL
jgi:hypothetical protein